MSRCYDHIKKWRQRTKQRALDAFGSKCGICGYFKCNSALQFHHLNPEEKDFAISRMKVNNWGKIVDELRKCICVCGNCHREIHDKITPIPKDIIRFDENYVTYKPLQPSKIIEYDKCPLCSNKKPKHYKYCSGKCYNKSTERVNWDLFDLSSMLLKKYTIVKISKIVGVSDNSIRKRLKKIGLPFKKETINNYIKSLG